MDHSILTVNLISSPAGITIGTKIWILQEICLVKIFIAIGK